MKGVADLEGRPFGDQQGAGGVGRLGGEGADAAFDARGDRQLELLSGVTEEVRVFLQPCSALLLGGLHLRTRHLAALHGLRRFQLQLVRVQQPHVVGDDPVAFIGGQLRLERLE